MERYIIKANKIIAGDQLEVKENSGLLIENGKSMECNTGGIRYGQGDTNPCADIFRLQREMGGELITIGADAHSPETLGIGFDYCREMLKDCGFRYYAVFHERKAEMLPLQGRLRFFADLYILPMTFAWQLH